MNRTIAIIMLCYAFAVVGGVSAGLGLSSILSPLSNVAGGN